MEIRSGSRTQSQMTMNMEASSHPPYNLQKSCTCGEGVGFHNPHTGHLTLILLLFQGVRDCSLHLYDVGVLRPVK